MALTSRGGGGRVWAGAARAFTLVELVAVLIVLGVLSAVAVVRLGDTTSVRRSAAAQQALRDFTFAKERAMNTSVVHWLTFIGGASPSYAISAEAGVGAGYASRVALVEPGTGRSMQRVFERDELAGVTLSFSASAVGFGRLGRPLETTGAARTTDATVTVGGTWTVTITASTGAITLGGGS
jgi:prepilin-type N-terminal cleavage/methylation domain-containing protein